MNTSTVWTTRVWREHRAGNISRTERDVLLTLRTFRGAGGTMHPSHATLADRARCSLPERDTSAPAGAAARLGVLGGAPRARRLAVAADVECLPATLSRDPDQT